MLLKMKAFDSLQSAYEDFQVFCRIHKLRHSQRRFTHGMLYKKAHGAFLATKGFNARIICEWIRDCLTRVAHHVPVDAPRKLKMVHAADHDERLRHCCIATNLDHTGTFFPFRHILFETGFVLVASKDCHVPLLWTY